MGVVSSCTDVAYCLSNNVHSRRDTPNLQVECRYLCEGWINRKHGFRECGRRWGRRALRGVQGALPDGVTANLLDKSSFTVYETPEEIIYNIFQYFSPIIRWEQKRILQVSAQQGNYPQTKSILSWNVNTIRKSMEVSIMLRFNWLGFG